MSGNFTPAQRQIVRNRCQIDVENFNLVYQWLKENNPNFDPKNPDPSISSAPYQLFNVGNNSPVALMDYVHAVEKALNKKGKIVYKPIQPGDVSATYANVESLFEYIDFKPSTTIEEGIKAFVDKYLELNKLDE